MMNITFSHQTVAASKPIAALTSRSVASSSSRNRQVMVVCKAAAISPVGTAAQKTSVKALRSRRVLPLLSELVDVQATTTAFETFAGRSAMVGFAVAFAAEELLPMYNAASGGLFGAWTDAESYALLGVTLVACSAALALASTRSVSHRLGRRLLEPVLASLTSKSRSAGAVTAQVNVDGALDIAFDGVFNASFVRDVFPSDTDSDDSPLL